MKHRPIIACLVMCAGLAAPALAQQDRADKRPGDAPALRGPRVGDERPPSVREGFGGDRPLRDRPARAPMREFMQAMALLEAEETPDALRLSPEQHDQLDAILAEQRGTLRRDAGPRGPVGEGDHGFHGERKPDEARRQKPDMKPDQKRGQKADQRRDQKPDRARAGDQPRDRDADRPERPRLNQRPDRPAPAGEGDAPRADRRRAPGPHPAGDDMEVRSRRVRPDAAPGEGRPAADPAVRERLEARAAEMQTRAWAVLNDAQRQFVKAEMERIRADQGEEELNRRTEEYLRRRHEAAAQDGRPPAPGAAVDDRRAERARRLSDMSPEERRAAVQKFRERTARERGQPKPPPDINDLDMPSDPE